MENKKGNLALIFLIIAIILIASIITQTIIPIHSGSVGIAIKMLPKISIASTAP